MASVGVEIGNAVKLATAWATPVACGADNGVLMLPHTLKKAQASNIDDSLGLYYPKDSDKEAITVAGDLNMYMRYASIDLLLALAMGTSGDPVQSSETLHSGTSTGGTTTTLTDSGATFGTGGELDGKYIVMTDGTGERQIVAIASHTNTELTFPLGTSPDADTVYRVVTSPPSHVGTATAGAGSTLTDSNQAFGTSSELDGLWITTTGGTGSGQTRAIASHTATEITVGTAWTVTPDATTLYEIFGDVAIHTYELATDLDDLFATFCVDNTINVDEYGSVKVTGFVLTGEVGQPISIAFNLLSYDRVTDSVTNTLATFANVTFREDSNRILFSQMVMRLNAQSGGALEVGDKICPNKFTLTYTRTMEGVYGTCSGTDNIDEPTNSGMPVTTLTIEFPRYEATTYFDFWDADTSLKADITFTGAVIADTIPRKLVIPMPHLKIDDADLPIEAGILKHPITLNVLGATAAPSGMTVVNPFEMELTNDYGGDPLQEGND
jgi:hypothetical protein